jgi:S-adenosylmethionine hydrolase
MRALLERRGLSRHLVPVNRHLPLVALALAIGCTEPAPARAPAAHEVSTATPAAPRPIVVLMTDFGTKDDAVSLLRGAVLSIARNATVLDLTHEVPRFDIAEGARLLEAAPGVFPEGTVFVCVVDPGVGTTRKPIALRLKNGRTLIGPDNGLLSLAAEKWGVLEARVIADPRFLAKEVSTTFHGRDVFAPTGAHVAIGDPPFSEVGPLLPTWTRLEAPPATIEGGVAKGVVVAIDEPFGNIWTNLTADTLAKIGARPGDRLLVEMPGRALEVPWVATFGDVPEQKPLGYVNSRGGFAVGINMGDAARTYGASRGDSVKVSKAK